MTTTRIRTTSGAPPRAPAAPTGPTTDLAGLDGDGPVVRVGNVEITESDNSFPDSRTVAHEVT